MDLRGIVFDVDGTLGDSVPTCFSAFRQAFLVTIGQNLSNEEIEALFGPTEQGTVRQVAGDGWEKGWEAFLEDYQKNHTDEPFPGIETALQILQQHGIALGVATGKGKPTTTISLERWGILDYFEVIETGSDEGPVKPKLLQKIIDRWEVPPDSVAYVGDAATDVDAARQVGMIPLSAAWSDTAHIERIIARDPSAIFTSVESFISWIEENIEAETASGVE